MNILQPEYYDKFQCKGDKCLYHCCQCWGIIIDDAAIKKYKKYDGELAKAADCIEKVKEGYSCIKLDENRQCPLLDENGLCEVVKQKGPQDLSDTCTIFPRVSVVTVDEKEKNLSIGCPHVVEFLKDIKSTLSFVSFDDGEDVDVEEGLDDKVKESIEIDLWIRNQLIDCVQGRDYPLWLRIFMGYVTLEAVKESYRKRDYAAIARHMGAFLSKSGIDYVLNKYAKPEHLNPQVQFVQLQSIAKMLRTGVYKMVGKDRKRNDRIVEQLYKAVDTITWEDYEKLSASTKEFFAGEEYFFENIFVILLYEELLTAFERDYLFNNYNLLILLHMMMKYFMQLYIYVNGEISSEVEMIIVSILDRCFVHGKKQFTEVINELNRDDRWNASEVLMYLYEEQL